jgi:hypothetical protein
MGDEQQQYHEVCKGEFQALSTKLDKVLNKLYIDNGGESFQSRLNRIDIWIARATRIAIAIGVVLTGLTVDAVQEILRSLF